MLKQFTDKYGDDLYVDPGSVTAIWTDYTILENPPRLIHGTMIMIGSERLFVKETASKVSEELM